MTLSNYNNIFQLVHLDFSPLVPEQFQMLLNMSDKTQALSPIKCCLPMLNQEQSDQPAGMLELDTELDYSNRINSS